MIISSHVFGRLLVTSALILLGADPVKGQEWNVAGRVVEELSPRQDQYDDYDPNHRQYLGPQPSQPHSQGALSYFVPAFNPYDHNVIATNYADNSGPMHGPTPTGPNNNNNNNQVPADDGNGKDGGGGLWAWLKSSAKKVEHQVISLWNRILGRGDAPKSFDGDVVKRPLLLNPLSRQKISATNITLTNIADASAKPFKIQIGATPAPGVARLRGKLSKAYNKLSGGDKPQKPIRYDGKKLNLMKKLMAPAVSQVEAELMNVWDESAPTKVVVPLAPELRTPRKTALLSVLKKPDQLNYRDRSQLSHYLGPITLSVSGSVQNIFDKSKPTHIELPFDDEIPAELLKTDSGKKASGGDQVPKPMNEMAPETNTFVTPAEQNAYHPAGPAHYIPPPPASDYWANNYDPVKPMGWAPEHFVHQIPPPPTGALNNYPTQSTVMHEQHGQQLPEETQISTNTWDQETQIPVNNWDQETQISTNTWDQETQIAANNWDQESQIPANNWDQESQNPANNWDQETQISTYNWDQLAQRPMPCLDCADTLGAANPLPQPPMADVPEGAPSMPQQPWTGLVNQHPGASPQGHVLFHNSAHNHPIYIDIDEHNNIKQTMGNPGPVDRDGAVHQGRALAMEPVVYGPPVLEYYTQDNFDPIEEPDYMPAASEMDEQLESNASVATQSLQFNVTDYHAMPNSPKSLLSKILVSNPKIKEVRAELSNHGGPSQIIEFPEGVAQSPSARDYLKHYGKQMAKKSPIPLTFPPPVASIETQLYNTKDEESVAVEHQPVPPELSGEVRLRWALPTTTTTPKPALPLKLRDKLAQSLLFPTIGKAGASLSNSYDKNNFEYVETPEVLSYRGPEISGKKLGFKMFQKEPTKTSAGEE